MPRLFTSLVVLPVDPPRNQLLFRNRQAQTPLTSFVAQPVPSFSILPPAKTDAAATDSLSYSVDFRGKRLMNDSPLGLKLRGPAAVGSGHAFGWRKAGSD